MLVIGVLALLLLATFCEVEPLWRDQTANVPHSPQHLDRTDPFFIDTCSTDLKSESSEQRLLLCYGT